MGSVSKPLQANNTKLIFAKAVRRTFPSFQLKEDDAVFPGTLQIHFIINIDIMFRTNTTILWQWRSGLENHMYLFLWGWVDNGRIEIERSSIGWITLQIPATARTKSGWSQQVEAQYKSPTCVTGRLSCGSDWLPLSCPPAGSWSWSRAETRT